MRNSIRSYCRIFWGFMYTVFFILGWVSFYNTKICIDIVRVVTEGEKSKIFALTTYVALGLVVYCLLLVDFPLISLIYKVLTKRVNDAELILGVEVVNAGCKFLTTIIFPILCACMGEIFEDEASLRTSIGILGSLLCLLVCHANPADYGLSDAFLSIWLGVFLTLSHTLEKCVVLIIIGVSMNISKEVEVHKRSNKEAQIL